jgi:hypothetical protein
MILVRASKLYAKLTFFLLPICKLRNVMTIQLAQPEFQGLVRILQSQAEFAAHNDRQNLITLAFGMSGKADIIRARLNLSGPPMSAAVELIRFLSTFGQVEPGIEALGVFLDQLLVNMGLGDDADFMAEIIARHKLVNPPTAVVSSLSLPLPTPIPSASEKYVFISYARPEQAIAEQIENYLKSTSFRVFRDTQKIHIGDNWDMTIEAALNEATHMILLLSAASMPYRKEVHREWFFFDQKRKPILPLYVQDCTLHSRMIAYNYADARTDLLGALNKLITRIV